MDNTTIPYQALKDYDHTLSCTFRSSSPIHISSSEFLVIVVEHNTIIVIIIDIVVIGGVTVVVGNHRVVMDVVRIVNRSHQVTVHVVGVVAGVEVEVGHRLSQVLSQIKVGVIVTAVVGVITVQSMINHNKVFMNRKVIITST